MAQLRLSFLGSPQVWRGDHMLSFSTRKALALLTYLTVEGSFHSRDKLAAWLWPESDTERSRGALRTALTFLRNALRAGEASDEVFITIKQDTIGFDFNSDHRLDVQLLQTAYNLTRQPSSFQLNQQIDCLRRGVELYRGDFLEGFSLNDAPDFDDWASTQREAWHQRMTKVLQKLTYLQTENGDLTGTVDTALRWVAHDPLDEEAYRSLMQAYAGRGERAAALQVYEKCQAKLERELGTQPEAQTVALAQQIRNQNLPVLTSSKLPPTSTSLNNSTVVAFSEPLRTQETMVLAVDDDPDLSSLLNLRLEKAGYKVVLAQNGAQALDMLDRQHFDLLITDAMMPQMSGYELIRQVRTTATGAALPIMMLTALNSENDALQAFRDGVDEFVTKPYSQALLLAKISSLLKRSQHVGVASAKPPLKASSRAGSGFAALDQALGGSWPNGSNILLLGEFGSGKSTFARRFLVEGLNHGQKGLLINIDDSPAHLRQQLDLLTNRKLTDFEAQQRLRLVNATDWNDFNPDTAEQIENGTGLSRLAAAIMQAGAELGQDITHKVGGRRVLDSISSLFLYFDLAVVQRFLAQLARTANSYGEVSTLFLLEEGAVDDRTLNNIKYLMDGIFEFRYSYDDIFEMRVANFKWQAHFKEWFRL